MLICLRFCFIQVLALPIMIITPVGLPKKAGNAMSEADREEAELAEVILGEVLGEVVASSFVTEPVAAFSAEPVASSFTDVVVSGTAIVVLLCVQLDLLPQCSVFLHIYIFLYFQ